MHQSHEIATLGGGCFWCLEAIFSELRGVKNVISGYSGGSVPNPSYQNVSSGTTGHAEVVQVTFDPMIISFKRNPDQMYCNVVISPKIAKFRKQYFMKLKKG